VSKCILQLSSSRRLSCSALSLRLCFLFLVDNVFRFVLGRFAITWNNHYLLNILLLLWHAPLGVHSAICRHQPAQRTVLGEVDFFVQCEVVGSQIMLDGVQPRDTRMPQWSFPVIRWGAVRNTHPFNGPVSGTTWVSQYQKG